VDPRLTQATGNWFTNWLVEVAAWVFHWVVTAAGMGVAAIVGCAGWTLGQLTGAIVMLLLLTAIYRRLRRES
jgi:putative AlgH/UPF0301 family transcriptional regulator